MKKKFFIFILLMIASSIILGSINIWSPVCNHLLELSNGNMVHMKCYYTSKVCTLLGLLIFISGVNLLLNRKQYNLLIFCLGFILIFIDNSNIFGFGICLKNSMPCNTTMIWIKLGGFLTILAGILDILFTKKFK